MACTPLYTPHWRFLFRHFVLSLLVFGQVFAAAGSSAADEKEMVTVVTDRLNLRSGPGTAHPVVATLSKGARVRVLSRNGDWAQVSIGGKTGFLSRRHLSPVSSLGSGAKSPPSTPAARKAELARKLDISKKEMTALVKEETNVFKTLEETEKELNHTRQSVSRLSAELSAADTQLKANAEKYRKIEARARTAETYAADRLVALYKLGWFGRLHLLASAESTGDFFFRKRSMETILKQDEAVMSQLATDKAEMQALIRQMEVRKAEKQAVAQNLADRMNALQAQRSRRASLLKTIRQKKSLQQAAITTLEAASQELDRTIAALEAAQQAQAKEARAPKKESPHRVSASRTTAAPSPSSRFASASRSSRSAAPVQTAGKPFSALKGLLRMPVDGNIVSFFGRYTDQKFNVTNFKSGITIKANRKAPIKAVHGGKALFSSWFKGFGNMIIISHGEHYYTVYAHLEERYKAAGDQVSAGEVIGTVGNTGSANGAGLYFEIRHYGKPVNPIHWIRKG
ncbi:peptidoglycan DD-metalloendopeptidase family protein [Desulfosarcina sp. OttesenSCG-928-A07]|nr:peptidoglycan DD-metalloendopeptidase family protein [Desulfosarcina sp. OttesenSCG-928-A07]